LHIGALTIRRRKRPNRNDPDKLIRNPRTTASLPPGLAPVGLHVGPRASRRIPTGIACRAEPHEQDAAYQALLHAAERAIDASEPRAFRVRVKATSGPRTRTLALALALTADSVELARALAMSELVGRWTVLEAKAA